MAAERLALIAPDVPTLSMYCHAHPEHDALPYMTPRSTKKLRGHDLTGVLVIAPTKLTPEMVHEIAAAITDEA